MKILTSKEKAINVRIRTISLIFSFFLSAAVLIFKKNPLAAIITFFVTIAVIFSYFYFKKILDESSRIQKMESVFPDFLQLMSSNLRAGMTIDKAILLSSRPEFSPLDREILQAGKDIATSKNIESALTELGQRTMSEKIKKTIQLVISGIQSGGNLAILLEETSSNMREKEFIEKRAYSNVLMYVIFIFMVVSVFAPALFSLSNILVEVFTRILSGIPAMENSSASTMAFSFSEISISTTFVQYFSVAFILMIDLFASLIIGLVSKGEEKEGLRYFPVIAILSIITFFVAKIFIGRFLGGLL